MSGILKRKLEEGPSPYLSLQGSEDDEVSCSDSGNSSDSLNHPIPSGLLDSTHQQQSKRMRGRNVHFESVTVYYFNRRQGFTSVPTQGGSTLGMSPRHSGVRRFTLREFAMEQKLCHRNMLRDHLKEEKLNAIKLKLTKNGTVPSMEADTLTLDDISEDDLDVDNTEVDDYFFLQPLTTRRRRTLLRASGVRRINVEEKHELRGLRVSREECGCRCRGICDPETCACSLAGIKCQVDRMSFPCGCTKDGCSNGTGRLEFNPVRVRTHFLHTIMKLQLEKSRQEPQQQQQQQLVTNGNGYHGDSSLVQQQQQNLQFPLMSGTPHSPIMQLQNTPHIPIMQLQNTPHIPIMQLQNTGDTDLRVEEEEEEEEEEDEDEDDEAYEEDGSSVCSGLSDCSTHSLETLHPEEEEETEEDEEDEEDEEEDDGGEDEEEEEEDWGTGPPLPYSVPLPSLSYSNNTLMSLGINPFHNTPSMQRYQIDSPVNDAQAFLCENVPSLAPTTLPAVETALESELKPELHRQMGRQGVPLHFPGPTESTTSQTCPLVEACKMVTAAANQQALSTDIQNIPDCCDSQTEVGPVETDTSRSDST